MSLALDDHHSNDNLITQLFSHLAAMLAIEQSAELATQHNLSPADALEAEGKALRRAVEMESCELVWVRERAGYELHPSSVRQQQQQQRGHGHGQTALVGAAGIALSPAPAPSPLPSPTQLKSKNPSPLHITVSTPSPQPPTDTSTEEHHQQPPTIIATTPIPQNTTPTPHVTASPRTSTLPHTESPVHDALATLDLGTMTLGISTEAVVRAVPGWLYGVDSVVAAVLAVGFVDGRVGGVLWGMDVGDDSSFGGDSVGERERKVDQENNPTSPNHDRRASTSTTKQNPKDTIQIYTTKTINTIKTTLFTIYTWTRSLPTKIPPTLSLKLHLPILNSTASPNNTTTTAKPNKPKPSNPNPKTQKFLLEEFDLDIEHYGGDSSQEGGQLPTATRGILKALFWGLEVAVCGLVMLVKGCVWLVLRVSGWVCSVADAVRRWAKE